MLDEPQAAALSPTNGWSPDLSTRTGDRALVELALRLGELSQRDAILRAGATALASALALPASWSPDVPPELPLSRWLYLRDGQLVYDGPPAPELETRTDEALA